MAFVGVRLRRRGCPGRGGRAGKRSFDPEADRAGAGGRGVVVMRIREGLRRLAALVAGGALILLVVGTRPQWERATGRVVPRPAGGRPHLVELVEPRAWLRVTGWTDGEGRFLLFASEVGAEHTLRVERSGCGPAVVGGVRFEPGADALVVVPSC